MVLEGTIRPGKDRLAKHCGGSGRKKKRRQVVGRQRQRTDMTGVSRVTKGCGGQTEMEVGGCEIIGGAPTTFRAKGRTETDSRE